MITEVAFLGLVVLVAVGLALLSEPVPSGPPLLLSALDDESRPGDPETPGVTVWAESEPGPKGVRGWIAGLKITWLWPWKTRAEKAAEKAVETEEPQKQPPSRLGSTLLHLWILFLSLVGFFFAAIFAFLFAVSLTTMEP